MNKEVKVTLGVAIQGFISGLNTARTAFSGFTNGLRSGVSDGLALFAHLGQAVSFLGDIFQGLTSTARTLFDTFVSGVAVQQRLENQLMRLMGSADSAKGFIKDLGDENARLGFVTDDMLPAINQFATALKAMDGQVKPERLGQMADMFRRIKAARPELGAEEITRAILAAARGDIERIKMLLGVGLDDVAGMSEKAQKTMQALKTTGDQQLGEVTKVSSSMKPQTQDMLDLFDEYLDKLGMTQQATEDTANDWDRNVAKMTEIWDRLKERIGAPILETLNRELSKLADWLTAHQEQINKFADKLGSLAAKGLENAMEALMEVDWDKVMESGVAFAEAFSKVDWKSIADTIGAVADFANFMQNPVGNTNKLADSGQIAKAGLGPNDPLGQLFGGVGSAPQSGRGNAGAAQQIEVKISIDDDAKLSAVVENKAAKAANQQLGDLVHSTRSKSSGGSKRK